MNHETAELLNFLLIAGAAVLTFLYAVGVSARVHFGWLAACLLILSLLV